MLQLKKPYSDIRPLISSWVKKSESSPSILESPFGSLKLEGMSYIEEVAEKVIENPEVYLQKYFDLTGEWEAMDEKLKAFVVKSSGYSNFGFPDTDQINKGLDSMVKMILKNQGKESAMKDILWLFLQFPEHLPDELVGWYIPEFGEILPHPNEVICLRLVN